jgi:hypothetical protein
MQPDKADVADLNRTSRGASFLLNTVIDFIKTDNPDAQMIRGNLVYDALTRMFENSEPADEHALGQFLGALTLHLHNMGYRITPTTERPADIDKVADELHHLAGPGVYGYSQTVEVARGRLHDLAAALDTRTRITVDAFKDTDPLAYAELSIDQIAWRALLAVLSTTEATVSIPRELMPSVGWILQMVAGWTLAPTIDTDAVTGHATISARPTEPATVELLSRLNPNLP